MAEYEDYLIRESVGDGTIDPDDLCMVCDKRDCICPPEEDFPVPVLAKSVVDNTRNPSGEARESTHPLPTVERGDQDTPLVTEDSRGGENSFDLDTEIDRQRAAGYETFDDYITRTGFPRDEASYAAFIGEGKWMLTSKDKPI